MFNLGLYPGVPILDAAALAGITTYVISILKPFVERLPFAKVGKPTHDSSIQLLNLLINTGFVLVMAGTAAKLSAANWPTYMVAAIGQAIGSEGLYKTTTRSGGSITGGNPVKR